MIAYKLSVVLHGLPTGLYQYPAAQELQTLIRAWCRLHGLGCRLLTQVVHTDRRANFVFEVSTPLQRAQVQRGLEELVKNWSEKKGYQSSILLGFTWSKG